MNKLHINPLALAVLISSSLAYASGNNPYDKVGDGVSSVGVSSESLVKKVNKNTLDISSNKTAIEENASAIAENRESITHLNQRVSTAEVNISRNSADIATNRSNISTNTANISTNKTAISRNASNISTNATNISKNASNISTNTTRIGSLEGRMTSAESDIRTANDRLKDHANTLADHERRISQNEDDIASGGGPSEPEPDIGWVTLYSGAGVNAITIPNKEIAYFDVELTYAGRGGPSSNYTTRVKTANPMAPGNTISVTQTPNCSNGLTAKVTTDTFNSGATVTVDRTDRGNSTWCNAGLTSQAELKDVRFTKVRYYGEK
ncbi:hypothetical protein [Vibrio agarivorans]|uniref:Uncharacterized protein n=1 Tax=Vibrio agarivorans TaxID=153622 RepID=A0ABT7Y7G2_9VIBR|nr:hypothetical protein [Vibrio agarivorans]MDN2483890.1 hypothetical protein [Vibrio agarivorans]